MDALYEPTRKVHNMWISEDKAEHWVPQRQYQYLGGSQGGTEANPSARMIDMASRQKCSIVEILLEYITLKDVFGPMSKYTQYYACEKFVANSKSNGNDTKKKIFIPCQTTDINARHRLLPDKNRKWRFTPGRLLHGIVFSYTIAVKQVSMKWQGIIGDRCIGARTLINTKYEVKTRIRGVCKIYTSRR